jgi:addiction module HigA family antidote
MLDNNLPPHPGEILTEEFLGPLDLTQTYLAERLGVPIQRINEIARGRRGITSDTAWLFAGAFGTSPEFWMNLQVRYDPVPRRAADLARLRAGAADRRYRVALVDRQRDRAGVLNPPAW